MGKSFELSQNFKNSFYISGKLNVGICIDCIHMYITESQISMGTSVPGKILEKIVLGVIEKHQKDNAVIDPSQHRFTRGKSCLTNLISFYDKVTHLVDQGKPVNVIFWGFSKALNTVSHSILLDKMPSVQLDKHIPQWVSNWLMGRAQRVTVNGVTSGWGHSLEAFCRDPSEGQYSLMSS